MAMTQDPKLIGGSVREDPQQLIRPNIWYVYVPPINRILKISQ